MPRKNGGFACVAGSLMNYVNVIIFEKMKLFAIKPITPIIPPCQLQLYHLSHFALLLQKLFIIAKTLFFLLFKRTAVQMDMLLELDLRNQTESYSIATVAAITILKAKALISTLLVNETILVLRSVDVK
jgi:hypothetical protein